MSYVHLCKLHMSLQQYSISNKKKKSLNVQTEVNSAQSRPKASCVDGIVAITDAVLPYMLNIIIIIIIVLNLLIEAMHLHILQLPLPII